MKKYILISILFFSVLSPNAQTNYTGSYGYSMKPTGTPPRGEKATGPSGSLVLVRLEGNKYRFWLDVNKGWPSYNLGTTNGTITFKNDTASFNNTSTDAKAPCMLNFKILKSTIEISNMSNSADCGFGNGVVAEGKYAKWKVQPKLNNTWLKDQYSQASRALVTATKATVYKDENGTTSTNSTVSKGEVLINVAENDTMIYTEKFNGSKFVYGWVKKSALKMMEAD